MTSTSHPPLILVVEENEGVRNLLQTALSIQGFLVLVAANGAQAVEIYRERSADIDLVLMDVNMDGLSGPETLVTMQQKNAQVQCCFMSGDTSASRLPELLQLGALCVFGKPFSSLLELSEQLREYLAIDGSRAPS